MIISTSHKFVYCSIPKVASRTLRSLFEPLIDEDLMKSLFRTFREKCGNLAFHRLTGVRERMIKLGLEPDEYFWFGFMRNPWDRAVSRYHFEHTRAKVKGSLEQVNAKHVDYHKSMIGLSWEDYLLKAPYFPQSERLRDESGIAVERVFRLEELDSSLIELGEILRCNFKMPGVEGATERERDYQIYFENKKQIEAVSRYYAEDILLGGYRFDGSFGEALDLNRLSARPS